MRGELAKSEAGGVMAKSTDVTHSDEGGGDEKKDDNRHGGPKGGVEGGINGRSGRGWGSHD